MHARTLHEAMELAERTDMWSKHVAKGSVASNQKQKNTKKGNKKGWRGKCYGGAGPSKGLVSHIEAKGTVSTTAVTKGKLGSGAAKKDHGKGARRLVKCCICGASHRFFEYPKWKLLIALASKKPVPRN